MHGELSQRTDWKQLPNIRMTSGGMAEHCEIEDPSEVSGSVEKMSWNLFLPRNIKFVSLGNIAKLRWLSEGFLIMNF